MNFGDGAPYELKGSRTVWGGGKDGDNIKVLPIAICGNVVCEPAGFGSGTRKSLARLAHFSAETKIGIRLFWNKKRKNGGRAAGFLRSFLERKGELYEKV